MNGGYDFVQHEVQYGGVQAVYNWNCCGLTIGYRRFELGTVGSTSRDETQWLYSFTLANFGAVGDIRRANSVFRDPTLPPPIEVVTGSNGARQLQPESDSSSRIDWQHA